MYIARMNYFIVNTRAAKNARPAGGPRLPGQESGRSHSYSNSNMNTLILYEYYAILYYPHTYSYTIMRLYTQSPLQDSRLFGPRPWKVLAATYETNGFLSNPDPGENLVMENLAMETGCSYSNSSM